MRRAGTRAVQLIALGVVGVASAAVAISACKLSLTPDSVKQTYDAVKDAQKELTAENEYYIGRSVSTSLLARHDYHYLDADAIADGRLDGVTAYVTRVGNVVAFAAMATTRKGDRPSPLAGWHFTVIDDDAINAFAGPGGYIFVTKGAVLAASGEDELAAILAHEVAHVVRGHAIGSIKKSRWSNVATTFLDSSVELDEQALGDLTKVFEGALDDIVDSVLVKGYSRDTEFEADKVGAEIMSAAGYNPKAFTRYLRTLAEQQETGSGGWYATHPKASERVDKLEDKVAKLPRVKTASVRTERFDEETAVIR